jgi:hypothetical protein
MEGDPGLVKEIGHGLLFPNRSMPSIYIFPGKYIYYNRAELRNDVLN